MRCPFTDASLRAGYSAVHARGVAFFGDTLSETIAAILEREPANRRQRYTDTDSTRYSAGDVRVKAACGGVHSRTSKAAQSR
jgi:hypothetical protein